MDLDVTKTNRFAVKPMKTASLESFNHDGLEIARRKSKRREWPIREIALFALAVVSFKIFLFFEMGAAAYGAKIAEFGAGGPVEQALGWAMTLDPVSTWIVDGIRFGHW